MKSMFETSMFGRPGLPNYAAQPPMAALRGRMGQAPAAAPAAAPDASDTAGLTSGIQTMLSQVGPDVLGTYNTQFQACQAQINAGGAGLITGTACLYKLYLALDAYLKSKPAAPVAAPMMSADYTIPIVIGVLGLGVLIFAFSRPSAPSVVVAPVAAPAPVKAKAKVGSRSR